MAYSLIVSKALIQFYIEKQELSNQRKMWKSSLQMTTTYVAVYVEEEEEKTCWNPLNGLRIEKEIERDRKRKKHSVKMQT